MMWLLSSNAQAISGRAKSEFPKTDFSMAAVDLREIISGGPGRDGIPPIDSPRFGPAAAIRDVSDQEPVISISIRGQARAYPFRILIWHEIVNDEVEGLPVAVTFCPLCNAAVIFSRRTGKPKAGGSNSLERPLLANLQVQNWSAFRRALRPLGYSKSATRMAWSCCLIQAASALTD